MSPVRVYIVDDNFVARRGLRSVFETTKSLLVAGEASTGSEVIEKLNAIDIDIVLMDIRMPGIDGIEATGHITKLEPSVKVLILTVVDEPLALAKAINAGASGYLVYGHFEPQDLIESIKGCAGGERIGIPPISGVFPSFVDNGASDNCCRDALTQREREVLRLIATGKENREIARELSIEEKTVKNHINSIYSKLGIASRQEAILWALQNRSF